MPLIMVGQERGSRRSALFEERRATGREKTGSSATRNRPRIFFTARIEGFQKVLTRLDVAWSRDQEEKIYVQHRLLEHAKEVFDWLELGGAFYVCGDAARMAKDVDAALHQVIQTAAGKSAKQAAEYVKAMSASKRYQRDVY